ncbi:MAG: radical SAM protein [Proteobacteria bacterium]|nr:radical SAM protein [Pseudomonadota bacterium]MBU4009153.1 radical SAM protein [Pseudomonadota bacterium]
MPVELATLASFILESCDQVYMVDQFGTDPSVLFDAGDHYLQGVPLSQLLNNEEVKSTDCFILFAISYMSHGELLNSVREIKTIFPTVPIAVLENSQAVTGYSIQRVASSFINAGVDALICGEPYYNWEKIKIFLSNSCKGKAPSNLLTVHSDPVPVRSIVKGWKYPIPAWHLFNLEGYWRLPYSHGPKTRRFLPVLTSRGCPYPCDFCVVPETNNRQWCGNSPADVVEEIITLRDRYGILDFQVEDLNPTIQHQRWEEICELLISKQAGIRFYFVSGTKAETLHIDKIPLYARAGCRYLSISPESGSKELMQIIGKKFNYRHGIDLVKTCRSYGIRTQACFLVGHPNEHEHDFKRSRDYLIKMVHSGLDEVAIFMIAPFAGSKLYSRNEILLHNHNALPSFSPRGRVDYETYERRRKALIRTFFIEKLKSGFDLWAQGVRALWGIPQTKMENLPRRIAYIYWGITRLKISQLRAHNL